MDLHTSIMIDVIVFSQAHKYISIHLAPLDDSMALEPILKASFQPAPKAPPSGSKCLFPRRAAKLESRMDKVQVEDRAYQMPPLDGFSVAHFLTVADIERSARFYETVFGGRILSMGDAGGAP